MDPQHHHRRLGQRHQRARSLGKRCQHARRPLDGPLREHAHHATALHVAHRLAQHAGIRCGVGHRQHSQCAPERAERGMHLLRGHHEPHAPRHGELHQRRIETARVVRHHHEPAFRNLHPLEPSPARPVHEPCKRAEHRLHHRKPSAPHQPLAGPRAHHESRSHQHQEREQRPCRQRSHAAEHLPPDRIRRICQRQHVLRKEKARSGRHSRWCTRGRGLPASFRYPPASLGPARAARTPDARTASFRRPPAGTTRCPVAQTSTRS